MAVQQQPRRVPQRRRRRREAAVQIDHHHHAVERAGERRGGRAVVARRRLAAVRSAAQRLRVGEGAASARPQKRLPHQRVAALREAVEARAAAVVVALEPVQTQSERAHTA